MTTPKPVVGWREWVALPDLSIQRIKVKVDTGARSSALHAFDVELFEHRDERYVRFKVHPLQDETKTTATCEMPLHDERWIKSSNGKRELRPVIRVGLQFNGETWPIDLTLTTRDMMGFRMLLGREAVRRRFVVDPGRSFLVRDLVPKRKKKKKKKKKQ